MYTVSSTFTKCACGCFGDSIFTTAPDASSFDKNHSNSCPCRNISTSTVSLSDDDKHNNHNNITANPLSRNSNNNNNATTKYEFDDKNSNAVTVPVGDGGSNSSSSFMKQNRAELMRYAHLPSGLSVESTEDYSECSDSLPSPRPVPLLARP